jgi:sulfur carrier protein ThiS
MPAKIQYKDTFYEIRDGMTIRAALHKLDINAESVLITRNSELITDDEIMREDDHIRLIPVISGGSQG